MKNDIVGIKCVECGATLNFKDIKIKKIIEYEGVEIHVFDCPVCGCEVDDLQCDELVIKNIPPKEIEVVTFKPSYILFYKNDECLKHVLSNLIFCNPIREESRKDSLRYDYGNYELRAFKINHISDYLRGYKAWGVIVEKCLFDESLMEGKIWLLQNMIDYSDIISKIKVI